MFFSIQISQSRFSESTDQSGTVVLCVLGLSTSPLTNEKPLRFLLMSSNDTCDIAFTNDVDSTHKKKKLLHYALPAYLMDSSNSHRTSVSLRKEKNIKKKQSTKKNTSWEREGVATPAFSYPKIRGGNIIHHQQFSYFFNGVTLHKYIIRR